MNKYFYGHEVSSYGQEHNRVDYRTLAMAGDCVLNNDIIRLTSDIGYWELINGSECYHEDEDGTRYSDTSDEYRCLISTLEDEIYDLESKDVDSSEVEERLRYLEEDHYDEIFQYFIVSDSMASVLQHHTDEILFYNEELDMYVWGITHYGTAWDYVLTDIRLD